jgi:hypothetical protein
VRRVEHPRRASRPTTRCPIDTRSRLRRPTALATSKVERHPARSRHEAQEGVAVEAPVAVVTGLPNPRDEVGCVLLPSLSAPTRGLEVLV